MNKIGCEGSRCREAKREHAQHHRQLRQPERRREVGWGMITGSERGELESHELPQQHDAESKRQKIENDVGNRASEWREARLDQLDMMKAVIDLANRQADKGDDHKHVAAKLIRNLEGKVE